jgi:hypothetical protein
MAAIDIAEVKIQAICDNSDYRSGLFTRGKYFRVCLPWVHLSHNSPSISIQDGYVDSVSHYTVLSLPGWLSSLGRPITCPKSCIDVY